MTPTSATGDRRRRAGFTLTELLVVVAILGLMGAAVVLSVPDPRGSLASEAEKLGARLVRAREEALLTNRDVAVEADADGYVFRTRAPQGWTALEDGPFGPVDWVEGTAPGFEPGREAARFRFDPTGLAEPEAVTLRRDGRAMRVSVDGAGNVQIHAPR